MPTYQYTCTDCDEPLEVQQSFSDDSLTTCPACEGRLRKVFNAVGVVFKGSGFYRNDSRGTNGEGRDGGGGDKDSSGKSDDSGDKGADEGAKKGADKGADSSGSGTSSSSPAPSGSSKPASSGSGSAA